MASAIILAGGRGTRLRPYTAVLPKPLMPVGDRPVLDIVLRQLHRDGFDRITIATGYLAELIEAFFGDGARHGVQLEYHRETEPLGTVGAIRLIQDPAQTEDFLVVNGDVLTDIDYRALLERHRNSDAAATIATSERRVETSLGVVEMAEDGDLPRLTGYREKPALNYEVSMGVYCFAPRVLRYIEPGERLDFPDLVLRLIDANEVVRGWRSSAYWLDIGHPDDYERAMEEFEQMRDQLIPEE
jgi:NDP-sugar pyrophosphorylase family protein